MIIAPTDLWSALQLLQKQFDSVVVLAAGVCVSCPILLLNSHVRPLRSTHPLLPFSDPGRALSAPEAFFAFKERRVLPSDDE